MKLSPAPYSKPGNPLAEADHKGLAEGDGRREGARG
jgi:hypothetical protein